MGPSSPSRSASRASSSRSSFKGGDLRRPRAPPAELCALKGAGQTIRTSGACSPIPALHHLVFAAADATSPAAATCCWSSAAGRDVRVK